MGVEAITPPSFIAEERGPTPRDYSSFNLGALWLNSLTQEIWILVSKERQIATWRMFGGTGSGILTITGDSGGAVPGDGMDNINILGTSGEVVVTGDIPTYTLTISLGDTVSLSYPTDAGTALPSGNELNIIGGPGITTTGAGNTVTIIADAMMALQFDADTDFAVPIASQINFFGGTFIETSGDTLNNLTISFDSGLANSFPTNSGTATPSIGILNVSGGDNINTTGAGNTVTVILDNSILQPSTSADSLEGVYALGATDYSTDRFLHAFGTENVFLGRQSGNFTLTGSSNVGVGLNCLDALTTGSSNTSFGATSASSITTGSNNIVVGASSGSGLSTQTGNVLFLTTPSANANDLMAFGTGPRTVFHNYPGSTLSPERNIFMGALNGNFTLTGVGNSTLGYRALEVLTSGSYNTFANQSSGFFLTTGSYNSGIGNEALSSSVSVAGVTTGSYNVAFGFKAGGDLRSSDSSNIVINAVGVAAENNVLRIGEGLGVFNLFLDSAYIHGIWGKTSTGGIAALINSSGKLGTTTSSRRYKTNIEAMGDFSEKIFALRPVSFNYKISPDVTDAGLIAEEVHEIFPDLCAYDNDLQPDAVRYESLVALILNEMKQLKRRINILKNRIA